jgi:hypothetical protein
MSGKPDMVGIGEGRDMPITIRHGELADIPLMAVIRAQESGTESFWTHRIGRRSKAFRFSSKALAQTDPELPELISVGKSVRPLVKTPWLQTSRTIEFDYNR